MRHDWIWLIALMIFGLIPRLYTFTHTTVASRDCINFIHLAVNLDDPQRDDNGKPISRSRVLQKAEQPPGYPTALLGMAYLIHGKTTLGAIAWMQVGQLVSIVAGCWLVVPIYLLGVNAFERRTGLIAAALATALPTLSEIASDALSDTLFLAIGTSSLALIQFALKQQRGYLWLAAGAVGGAAYLVRPEGLLCLASGGLMLTGLFYRNRAERKQILLAMACLSLGYLAVAGPYVATIGKLTNKPSGTKLVGESRAERAAVPLFAAFDLNNQSPRILTGFKLAANESVRAANYGIAFIGLLGAYALRKNRTAFFLLVHASLSFLLLAYLGYTVEYVSRRHALTIAIIASVFAAAYLQWLAGNIGRYEQRNLAIFILIALCASYPFCFKPLHPNREGHRQAGLWVADHIPQDALFIDPFRWTEFVAGRSYRNFPNEDRSRKFTEGVVYVLIEPKNPTPGSRLALDFTKEYAAKGTLVYQWPPNVALETASVAIYRSPFP
jgi:hypothetical protein